jgi:hydrogenase maturation protease
MTAPSFTTYADHSHGIQSRSELHKATLLIGLGNPIMGDDAVGILVIRMLKKKFSSGSDLEFKELSVGGLRLVEEMLGYKRVFIADSIESESSQIGQIREFSPEQFKSTERASSPHVANFAAALELYRRLEPSKVPETIRIFTIDINPEFTFREGLSSPIQEAASKLAEIILREVEQVRG